jgi:hypothetical protein
LNNTKYCYYCVSIILIPFTHRIFPERYFEATGPGRLALLTSSGIAFLHHTLTNAESYGIHLQDNVSVIFDFNAEMAGGFRLADGDVIGTGLICDIGTCVCISELVNCPLIGSQSRLIHPSGQRTNFFKFTRRQRAVLCLQAGVVESHIGELAVSGDEFYDHHQPAYM